MCYCVLRPFFLHSSFRVLSIAAICLLATGNVLFGEESKQVPKDVEQSVLFNRLIDARLVKGTDPDVYEISISNLDSTEVAIYYLTVAAYESLEKSGRHNDSGKWNTLLGKNVKLKYGNYYFWIVWKDGGQPMRGRVKVNMNQQIYRDKPPKRPNSGT